MRYPRMLFRADETVIVADEAGLCAQHAAGFVARPLEGDGPVEAACYTPAETIDAEPDAPKRGRKPKAAE